MLTGKIQYIDGEQRYKYNIIGSDTSDFFTFVISSGDWDALSFLGEVEMTERTCTISQSAITVQTSQYIDTATNKKVAGEINTDFFCRLGALFRYVKNQCNTRNENGLALLQLSDGSMDKAKEFKEYTIPFPMSNDMNPYGYLAKVKLRYGVVYSMEITTDMFRVDLTTTNIIQLINSPKIKKRVGFCFNEDYLGFPLKPVVPLTVKGANSFGDIDEDLYYSSIEEIVANNPDCDFSWLYEKDYKIVTDDTLEEVCNYILNYDGYVYYDTETTGLKINFKSRQSDGTDGFDILVGVVLSVKYGESFYFPVRMKKMPNLCGGDHNYVMERYIRPILEGKKLVAHNMAFDWKVAHIYGINANIVHDTMILLQLTLGAEDSNYKVGLKHNAKVLLGRDSLELSNLVKSNSWGENDVKFWDLPADLVRLYACADTDNTNGLLQYCLQNQLLEKYGATKVYEIEVSFAFCVAYQEFYGHHIDVEQLDTLLISLEHLQACDYIDMLCIINAVRQDVGLNSVLSQLLLKRQNAYAVLDKFVDCLHNDSRYASRVSTLAKSKKHDNDYYVGVVKELNDMQLKCDLNSELQSLHLEKATNYLFTYAEVEGLLKPYFNPKSSNQLRVVLYNELKIPTQYDSASNKVTTDKKALKRLASFKDVDGNPKYPFVKYLTSFRESEGIRNKIANFPEIGTDDGYIFTEVNQLGAATGRVSVKNPNYQSYNDPVKKHIIARPGYYMFDTDYSSVESRVLAAMVGNKHIMKEFEDPDFDYHAYQAAHINGIPYSAVTSKIRKEAKGINFGLPYGMADASLGEIVYGERTPENTRKAAKLRELFFKGQEDIRDWFEQHRDHGVNEGYTETFFGRRRYYNRARFDEGSIRRQAGNQVIQGCLDGNTRIQTKDFGIVKIKDVVGYNGDIWDGERWTRGDVTYSGKKQKCIVRFRGGLTMVCSPIHKFLVRSAKGNDRFVECKDLKGAATSRSPHRVVINKKYEPSNCKYTSRYARELYTSTQHNAKNVFLDDITDSFKLGVVLGRLASDGSYNVRENGSSSITQIIAEHEFSIVSKLQAYMSSLGAIETDRIRDDHKQNLKNLTVYSKSLAQEVLALDIKHCVHDNIFMDTEVLRGFIQGFFDGDGGISGKTITLVFGTQYDFKPMCEDLQKALLFFGVRSRIRVYDDRYVLSIKTTDNAVFLDRIGFLNETKQEKGLKLECVEDEHIFGKCLVVDSVEITDEFIDMYDVCNTERGYYVADGVITHNTAADIYKIAVSRVFKRICREGWLGKVLFTGFIHDELLGEVSIDINPAIWLKILREEFEVKISNADGTPWCPLYMGFGYGTNWYEAKKTELPIRLQWAIVNNFGEEGFKTWTGDCRKFFDRIPTILRMFSVYEVGELLSDESLQGKEIKLQLNKDLIALIEEDASRYKKALSDYNNGATLQDIDAKYQIQRFFVDDTGKPLSISEINKKYGLDASDDFVVPQDTQMLIDYYCILHDHDRSKINVLNIPVFDAESNSTATGGVVVTTEDSDSDSAEAVQQRQLQMLGYACDLDAGEIYLLVLPQVCMQHILKYVTTTKEPNAYKVVFFDSDGILDSNKKNCYYPSSGYVTSKNMVYIRQLYLEYFNRLVKVLH